MHSKTIPMHTLCADVRYKSNRFKASKLNKFKDEYILSTAHSEDSVGYRLPSKNRCVVFWLKIQNYYLLLLLP